MFITKKPLLPQLKLVPVVGLGRFTVDFLLLKYTISSITAMVLWLLSTFNNVLSTYPLTEGSTETFTEGFEFIDWCLLGFQNEK
jgi:hypothetical protein